MSLGMLGLSVIEDNISSFAVPLQLPDANTPYAFFFSRLKSSLMGVPRHRRQLV